VANPLLALASLCFWISAVALAFESELYMMSVPLFACLVAVIFWLPQYHCRDCGATGQLVRWREHACEAVQARARSGQPRIIRGPTLSMQMVLWISAILLVMVVVCGAWL
jgi:hypothetical protein